MGQHIQVRVAAIEALRAAARAAGQDLAGEELSIASAAAIHGRQVDDLIAERGVPCKTFSAWLDRVAELLSR